MAMSIAADNKRDRSDSPAPGGGAQALAKLSNVFDAIGPEERDGGYDGKNESHAENRIQYRRVGEACDIQHAANENPHGHAANCR